MPLFSDGSTLPAPLGLASSPHHRRLLSAAGVPWGDPDRPEGRPQVRRQKPRPGLPVARDGAHRKQRPLSVVKERDEAGSISASRTVDGQAPGGRQLPAGHAQRWTTALGMDTGQGESGPVFPAG
jgi:hypothetical protein